MERTGIYTFKVHLKCDMDGSITSKLEFILNRYDHQIVMNEMLQANML